MWPLSWSRVSEDDGAAVAKPPGVAALWARPPPHAVPHSSQPPLPEDTLLGPLSKCLCASHWDQHKVKVDPSAGVSYLPHTTKDLILSNVITRQCLS